jgi:hypothetical protein
MVPNDTDPPSDEQKLRNAARQYLDRNLHGVSAFYRECCGIWHKSIPKTVGITKNITLFVFLALAVRAVLISAQASAPILVRKVYLQPPDAHANQAPVNGLLAALNALDKIDCCLIAIVIILATAPKALEKLGRRKSDSEEHDALVHLAAAMKAMPPIAQASESSPAHSELLNSALQSCLEGLKLEITQLLGEDRNAKLTDVTLLEFCDANGDHLQVRARTEVAGQTHRPIPSYKFLAYYVGMRGRAFAEHDFQNKRNPFPKHRLTIVGDRVPIPYRSVLYMPIYTSKTASTGVSARIEGTTEKRRVIDYCIGVVCVHCVKPYRFWRLGDSRRSGGGFGDIAYDRSLSYITLIKRLLEQTVPHVEMEST